MTKVQFCCRNSTRVSSGLVPPAASESDVSAASEAADGQTRLGENLPRDVAGGGQQRPGPEPGQGRAGGGGERGGQPWRPTPLAGGRRG